MGTFKAVHKGLLDLEKRAENQSVPQCGHQAGSEQAQAAAVLIYAWPPFFSLKLLSLQTTTFTHVSLTNITDNQKSHFYIAVSIIPS